MNARATEARSRKEQSGFGLESPDTEAPHKSKLSANECAVLLEADGTNDNPSESTEMPEQPLKSVSADHEHMVRWNSSTPEQGVEHDKKFQIVKDVLSKIVEEQKRAGDIPQPPQQENKQSDQLPASSDMGEAQTDPQADGGQEPISLDIKSQNRDSRGNTSFDSIPTVVTVERDPTSSRPGKKKWLDWQRRNRSGPDFTSESTESTLKGKEFLPNTDAEIASPSRERDNEESSWLDEGARRIASFRQNPQRHEKLQGQGRLQVPKPVLEDRNLEFRYRTGSPDRELVREVSFDTDLAERGFPETKEESEMRRRLRNRNLVLEADGTDSRYQPEIPKIEEEDEVSSDSLATKSEFSTIKPSNLQITDSKF